MRLGAILLVFATFAAVVFGVINFQQRMAFEVPDDGASWVGQNQGVQAAYIRAKFARRSAPASRPATSLVAINGVPVQRAVDVTKRLWALGVWSQAHYTLERGGRAFEALVVVAPAAKPLALENYLRVVGLLYLFIGLFIFARRWNAARAVHFYVFCLASFVLFSFHYTGKLNPFDWEVYWAQGRGDAAGAGAAGAFRAGLSGAQHRAASLAPACGCRARICLPALLLLVHIDVATGLLGFVPSLPARIALDQLELAYLGLYFLLAAAIFLNSYRRAPSGVLRQQLKWVTGGTLAGIVPFGLFYILPYSLGAVPRPWMNLSALSLALLPLCFAYAIIRYRLMDVDIIFKRGLAYTAATARRGGGVRGHGGADRRAVSHRMAERARRAKSSPLWWRRSCSSRSANGRRRAWTASSIATGSITAAR